MKQSTGLVLTLALSVLLMSVAVRALAADTRKELSAEDMAKANNPLADMKAINF